MREWEATWRIDATSSNLLLQLTKQQVLNHYYHIEISTQFGDNGKYLVSFLMFTYSRDKIFYSCSTIHGNHIKST